MIADIHERGRWLARHVLPHEALIRAKLRSMSLYGLDPEDVIQEVYAKFLTIDSLESIRFPKQYALLTARTIVTAHIRHSRVVSITSSDNLDSLEFAEPEANGEQRIVFQEEVQAVVAALDQLPKICRQTLLMRRLDGLSQKEVARRLKISEKTVEKHMATSARLLMKFFGRGGKSKPGAPNIAESVRSKDVDDKS